METRLTAAQIAEKLLADGWVVSYVIKDSGGYNHPSKFQVTVMKNKREFVTEYTKGSAHRIWLKGASAAADHRCFNRLSVSIKTYAWRKYAKDGQRVQMLPNFKMSSVNQDAFDDFRKLTAPIPPSIDEVLWALVSDANCVRNGNTLEDFCREFGYVSEKGDLLLKGKAVYDTCRDTWSALLRLGADLDALQELFQDY